ncbi:MAG: peptidylprolyl isomerase [Prevotella sp.]
MKRIITTLLFTIFILANTHSQQNERCEVMFETNYGNILFQLYDETPLHRDNFIKLVGSHYYDKMLFHRVIKDFMIQCGDPDSKSAKPGEQLGEKDCGYTIKPEFRIPLLFHKRGALAAAREPDYANPDRESSGSHFYVVWGRVFDDAQLRKMQARLDTIYGDTVKITPEMADTYKTIGGTPHLDGGYTVFGEVKEGLDVIDKIQSEATDKNNRPLSDIRITKAYITKDTRPKRKVKH